MPGPLFRSLFDPAIFDGPALFDTWNRILYAEPSLEVMFSGTSSWVSIMPDVLSERGIYAQRGIAGSGPTDRTASPGTLEFALRNDAGNSGGTASWYSPTHPDHRPGWQEGIPIRLRATFRDVVYPLWRGMIRTIDPTPGPTPRTVAVLAQDAAGDLAAARVVSIPPQIDKTEVQLLNAVIDALPPTARPDRLFDSAVDLFHFAYDRIGEGALALSMIQEATESALGTAFVDGLGRLRYINRQSEAAAEPALEIPAGDLLYRGPGFSGASSLRNVFNRIRITTHPKTEQTGAVLFRNDSKITLAAGAALEVWDSYSDPDNRQTLVGGFGFTALAPHTDYTAESETAVDKTTAITIAITPFTTAAKSVITNTDAASVIVTMRQLRGTAILDEMPITVEAYSAQPYGDRPAVLDLTLQDDPGLAQNLADYLLAQYSNRQRAGEELVFDPQRSATLMLGALANDIGSVVVASELTTGVDHVAYLVRAIAYTFERTKLGARLTTRYRLAPQVTSLPGLKFWTFDHPVYGLLDTGTIFGFA